MTAMRPWALALLLCVSCSTCEEPPRLGPPASVIVYPGDLKLPRGGTRRLFASVTDASGRPCDATVTWRSSDPSVAKVNGHGLIEAVGPGEAKISAIRANMEGAVTVAVVEGDAVSERSAPVQVPSIRSSTASSDATIRIDPTVRFQTMKGWEAVAQAGQVECSPTAFTHYRDRVFDMAVDDLGINRLRLEILSGAENRVDHFIRHIDGKITFDEWAKTRYEVVNDDPDPRSARESGFAFAAFDHSVETVVLPMKQRLDARGERLYINLCYVDFAKKDHPQRTDPEEYAELIAKTFDHLKERYELVPDALEIILEPDVAGWETEQIGRAAVAASDRLARAGFHPQIIAPSNTNMTSALEAFDQLMQMPKVADRITDLSYHRYAGVSSDALRGIGLRAEKRGVRTAMLEHIGAGHETLFEDLTVGRNSAWAQFALAFCGRANGAYLRAGGDPKHPTVELKDHARYLPQYFRHVRLNAVRYGATSKRKSLAPLAFFNTSGKWTVIVEASGAEKFSIGGLPPGRYGTYYTTEEERAVERPASTLKEGEALEVAIPDRGVITVYGY